MTLLQLRDAIKQEARVKVASNLDAMINQIVQEILRDYGNKARYREVLVLDSVITLVDTQSTYALPSDFQHAQALRYSIMGTQFIPLYEFTEGQTRVSDTGYPRYYQLCSAGIQLFPSSQILASNTLLFSYYQDPSTLYVDDADIFPIPRLEPVVKKAAISRVVRYMQNLAEAQTVQQDASASFVAGLGGQ